MKRSKLSGYFTIILISAGIIITLFTVIKNYFSSRCQDKYGLAYNQHRKALGIPALPVGWHIKQRDPDFIWWEGNEKVIGHKRKTIAFSYCDIVEEYDVYNLPLQHGQRRWLQMEFKYGSSNRPDSMVYTYQIEHNSKPISKRVADSLLTAEKIKNDY